MNPLVSIIVPVYNVSNFLNKCLHSIRNQTYSNIEIILVDDGSTDGSSEICDQFAKDDNRVRVFHKSNGGVSSARNYGLDTMSGEYVTFIDSDDFVEYTYIEELVKNITKSKADCCCCGFFETDEEYNILAEYSINKTTVISGKQSLEYHYSKYEYRLNLAMVCGKLFKSQLFREIRFCEGIYFEDIMIMPYWCIQCKIITFIPESLYYYYRNNSSITRKKVVSI